MDYVSWEIFVWALGLILAVSGLAIKYLMDRIKDVSSCIEDRKKECQELDARLDIIEARHLDTQISIVKINKDVEYIKMEQQKISLKIDELLKQKCG
jgi:Iap family predicted aminopeptidase